MGLFGSSKTPAEKAVQAELDAAKKALEQALGERKRRVKEIRAEAERLQNASIVARCGPIRLYADRVQTPSGTFPLTPELNASVDTAGAISSRVTATRLVLTGPFALAMKKKKDQRELFLYIDSPDGQHVQPCDPKEQMTVRKFAARVTTAARSALPPDDKDRAMVELKARYRALQAADTPVELRLGELRDVEARVRDAGELPEKYNAPDDPKPLETWS